MDVGVLDAHPCSLTHNPSTERGPVPSRSHEIPLRVVQNQPALAASLLRDALGYEVPDHDEALNTSPALTNCDPKEWNADGAVVLRKEGEAVLSVVIERQNGHDNDKRFSRPAYLATLYGLSLIHI